MVINEGKAAAKLMNSAEPQSTRDRKRKSHPDSTKNEEDTHLIADRKGNSKMKKRESPKHDGDAQDTRDNLPLHKLYELRPSTGKGMGTFAIRDIKRGTRIMCEKPLIRQLGHQSVDVVIPYLKLSDPDRATFLCLYHHPEAIDAAEEQSMRLPAGELITDEELKLMAIANTNAYEAGEGWVICPEASRINHSCLPNVHHCWNESLGAETVHAVRDIREGEEILTTYIDIRLSYYRRQVRLDNYGFMCDCPCCDSSTSFGKASKKRRERLQHIDREWDQVQNATQALPIVMESLDLLTEEGICNTDLTRAYREAANFNAELGHMREACVWAEKAIDNTVACSGKDYYMYQEDKQRLEDFVARRNSEGS